MPLRVTVLVPEPDAVRPAPVKSFTVRLPLEIATTTVRADEVASVPVPKAFCAKVIRPLLVETVIADGRFKTGRLTAEAVAVAVLTVMVLAAELPPVMPVLWPLSVTLTVPLPLALSLPLPR